MNTHSTFFENSPANRPCRTRIVWIRRAAGVLAVLCLPAVSAPGVMVTERWGAGGVVQHDKAVKAGSAKGGASTIAFDLAALPKSAKVYSARLFMPGIRWNSPSYEIVPVGGNEPLKLASPFYQWWDVTSFVADWAKAGSGSMTVRKGAKMDDASGIVLEIAYEGAAPPRLPPQVSEVKALYRSGQVFITFKETEPVDGGKESITWADVGGGFRGDYYGPVGDAAGSGARYRVYCHDRPITPESIGQARLVAEILPGSALNTRMSLQTDQSGKRAQMTAASAGKSGEGLSSGTGVFVLRSAVEPGRPVPPGTGLCVDTVEKHGALYYAVLSAADGVANAADISAANTAGPIEVKPAEPEPVMYKEFLIDLGGGVKYAQQWYSYWTAYPLSPWPARYDVVVGYCPEILAKPAPLYIARGGWNVWPAPSAPAKSTGLMMSHTADQPVDMLTGLSDTHGTQKGLQLGRYVPFFPNRQDTLIRWLRARWPVDPNRITAHLGDWGMQEIKRGDLYCLINGWGEPEMTKGFQSWGRGHGIWGPPDLYEGRPDDENPYVVSDVTDWVLAHPEKELPFVIHYARGGSHFAEMGWPPTPRFLWAMMKTRRAFVYAGRANPVEDAVSRGEIRMAMDLSVPAFANCTLDGNPGDGDIRNGENFAAIINGYVMWDSTNIVDEAGNYQITIWVDASSYHQDCLVDMTPRRCQKFKPAAEKKFVWTNTMIAEDPADGPAPQKPATGGKGMKDEKPALPAVARKVQSGAAVADKYGLVTLERIAVTKAKHRIEIRAE